MEPKTFYMPQYEFANIVTKEEPKAYLARRQKGKMRFLIIWSLLSLFLVFICNITFSTSILLKSISVGVWVVGIFAVWKFQRRVQQFEEQKVLSDEELLLDDEGFHWKQKAPKLIQVDISWSEISEIYPGVHIKYGKNKMDLPRIVYGENKDEILKIILQQGIQQAGLHKIIRKEHNPRDRAFYDIVYYVR